MGFLKSTDVKSGESKKLEKALIAVESDRTDAAERMKVAQDALPRCDAEVQKLIHDRATDEALAAARTVRRDVQDQVADYTTAVARADERIADIKQKLARIADDEQRQATVREIEEIIAEFEATARDIDAAAARSVEASRRMGDVVLEARALQAFSQNVRVEFAAAVEAIVAGARARARATIDKSAPPTLAKALPVLVEPPSAPPPTVVCFALRHVAWTDHQGVLRSASANTANIELPEAAAARGLQSGAVVLMSDQRVKQLARSRAELFVPDPARCELLDDSVIPPSTVKTAKHSAFPLPPGEAFEPLDRGPAYSMKAPPAPAVAARSITPDERDE
jgi:hypothetical protein